MTIPTELACGIILILMGYFVWNFRQINKILGQQLVNSVRLRNIEETLHLKNPFDKEKLDYD